MYEDGNYHDAELDAMQDDPIIQHDIRTGDYVQPKLGYFPYHGPHVTSLLIEAVKKGKNFFLLRNLRKMNDILVYLICKYSKISAFFRNIPSSFFHFICRCCCCCTQTLTR